MYMYICIYIYIYTYDKPNVCTSLNALKYGRHLLKNVSSTPVYVCYTCVYVCMYVCVHICPEVWTPSA